ncbi:MAG: HEAT repeat domain-containing protein [Proteobacteria bacterium]|nr:HEAT repeat domain-containing protein [Pseudomonadota bacterium]
MAGRKLKQIILEILETEDLDQGIKKILFYPYGRSIGPLISLFCSKEPLIKWKAVTVIGVVAGKIADADIEYARVIMRRLMWTLNDESGGIGWGVPEAMGEIMALSDVLAREYHKILISYISPGANFLEVPALQKGVLWGLTRLASERPEYLDGAVEFLPKFFDSEDPSLRGLSAFATLKIDPKSSDRIPESLYQDASEIDFYQDGEINLYLLKDFLKLAVSSPVNVQ